MKLLLTSAGITNATLETTLVSSLPVAVAEARVVYIPTAAENVNQDWVNENVKQFTSLGFASVDVIDISVASKDVWLSVFTNAHVLCFGGGDEFRLMHFIAKSGLAEELPALLSTRVWVGISAGSMVLCPILYGKVSHELYEESPATQNDVAGLNMVNFQFLPHLNSAYFPKLTEENITTLAEVIKTPIYAADDETAVLVHNGVRSIVGTGKCQKWNI